MSTLKKFAWLSVAASVVTIVLKAGAWWLTGSVGLLSDAAESLVNLVAAIVALIAITIAERPADDDHNFGHTKAEYFSAVFEGVMIVIAAGRLRRARRRPATRHGRIARRLFGFSRVFLRDTRRVRGIGNHPVELLL